MRPCRTTLLASVLHVRTAGRESREADGCGRCIPPLWRRESSLGRGIAPLRLTVPAGGVEILNGRMRTHEPPGYQCPFCAVAAGGETAYNAQTDVIQHDELTTAFVCPKWWAAAPAHVLVVPNEHYESVYSIPDVTLGAVYATAKRIAMRCEPPTNVRAHQCASTTNRAAAKMSGTSTYTSSLGVRITSYTRGTPRRASPLRRSEHRLRHGFVSPCNLAKKPSPLAPLSLNGGTRIEIPCLRECSAMHPEVDRLQPCNTPARGPALKYV
jgi:hypothetical protein